MILATMQIFDGWKVEEFETWEEAEKWSQERIKRQKQHYPYGKFPITYYWVKDKRVREIS